MQNQFNLKFTHDEAKQKLKDLLKEIGYSSQTIDQIVRDADSNEVKESLQKQREIVDKKM